jgi:hypothetical protein
VRRHRYRITIAGGLGAIGREAFADFHVEPSGIYTVLIGTLDQAGLHGALNRVLALGLELVELSRLPDALGARPPGRAQISSSSRARRTASLRRVAASLR